MPTCAECVFAGEPSPTIIKCRIRGTFHYIDDPACDEFIPHEEENGRDRYGRRTEKDHATQDRSKIEIRDTHS